MARTKEAEKKRKIDARKKGNKGEREVCYILNSKFGSNLRRTPASGGLSIKGDIIDTEPGTRIHDYHIEIKNQKTVAIKEWFRQALGDCGKKIPIVVFSAPITTKVDGKPPITRKQWFVVSRIEEWADELETIDQIRRGGI